MALSPQTDQSIHQPCETHMSLLLGPFTHRRPLMSPFFSQIDVTLENEKKRALNLNSVTDKYRGESENKKIERKKQGSFFSFDTHLFTFSGRKMNDCYFHLNFSRCSMSHYYNCVQMCKERTFIQLEIHFT